MTQPEFAQKQNISLSTELLSCISVFIFKQYPTTNTSIKVLWSHLSNYTYSILFQSEIRGKDGYQFLFAQAIGVVNNKIWRCSFCCTRSALETILTSFLITLYSRTTQVKFLHTFLNYLQEIIVTLYYPQCNFNSLDSLMPPWTVA